MVDIVCGAVNTQLTSLPARITRDVPLRREIETKVYEARLKIHDAVVAARQLAETGVDPTDPGATPRKVRK